MEPQIEKDVLDEIIRIHTESYVDRFLEWKACVDDTNELIRIIHKYPGEYFTYDSFCKEFNESIIEYLTVSEEKPSPGRDAESIVHEILMKRVERNLR